MDMTMPESETLLQSEVRLPGLMGEYTDEELNQHTIDHAKYFTVVQINRGGFVKGGTNYIRHQVDTLEDARIKAAELYAEDPAKKGILIYAVADFAGANGFSRPVENYPRTNYMTKGDKAKLEKKQKAEARQKLRDARMNLGEGRINKPAATLVEPVVAAQQGEPEGWWDNALPMAFISDDDED